MGELRPCPFCGGEATIDNAGGKYQAWCKHCCCIHMGEFYNTEAEAIAAWNRRSKLENEAIVHCAECEHFTPSPMGGNGCLIRFTGRTEIIPRNPTDFCSHGVRKPERSEG